MDVPGRDRTLSASAKKRNGKKTIISGSMRRARRDTIPCTSALDVFLPRLTRFSRGGSFLFPIGEQANDEDPGGDPDRERVEEEEAKSHSPSLR